MAVKALLDVHVSNFDKDCRVSSVVQDLLPPGPLMCPLQSGSQLWKWAYSRTAQTCWNLQITHTLQHTIPWEMEELKDSVKHLVAYFGLFHSKRNTSGLNRYKLWQCMKPQYMQHSSLCLVEGSLRMWHSAAIPNGCWTQKLCEKTPVTSLWRIQNCPKTCCQKTWQTSKGLQQKSKRHLPEHELTLTEYSMKTKVR